MSATLDDLLKLDLRVGRIIEAQAVEGTDKLIRVIVDLGNYGKRQIITGVRKRYKPEELVGKLVVVAAGLKPRKIRGLMSEGMILAADAEKPVFIVPEEEVEPGTKIIRTPLCDPCIFRIPPSLPLLPGPEGLPSACVLPIDIFPRSSCLQTRPGLRATPSSFRYISASRP